MVELVLSYVELKRYRLKHLIFIISGVLLFILCNISYAKTLPLHLLKSPQGFTVELYAYPVPDARSMTLGPKNIVFVGSKEAGNVYALIPNNNTHTATVVVIASGFNMPNGVAYYQHDLYVADINKLLVFKDIITHLKNPPKPKLLVDSLPDDTHHGWRYIRFGPDGKLYMGIGAPCNVCLKDDLRYASILQMNPDGTEQKIYAHGVRNTVGFDWEPTKKELWFTDNGRDWMGDDIPPDELNHAVKENLHFGFPYCHGKNISDPHFGKKFPCSAFIPPALELPAHAADLGMIFYKGHLFPKEYQNQVLIAQHGSWNRSSKIGYDVVLATIHPDSAPHFQTFISGWLHDNKVWGRPVDLLEMPDGSVLISDDYAGAVYRVTYHP